MKIVLSPAKSLDFNNHLNFESTTTPMFLNESERLVKKLQKLSPKKISKLMGISDNLSSLNHQRFQDWQLPFTKENASPALAVFMGDAYIGMDAQSFSPKDLVNVQQNLRILSGLYGLLKPADLIQAYRLEMGTKFAVTPKMSNLYKFWGDKLTNQLNAEIAQDGGTLINLASNEYFKAVNLKKLKARVITCHFKEEKNNGFQMVSFFAKHARGSMTRYIVQHNIQDPEHIKSFDLGGYLYNKDLSKENDWVFTRPDQTA